MTTLGAVSMAETTRRRRRLWRLVACLLVSATCFAQPAELAIPPTNTSATKPPSEATISAPAPTTAAIPNVTPAPVAMSLSRAELDRIHEDIAASEQALQDAIAKSRPSWWERFLPAFMGFLGILLGGLWSTIQQRRQLIHSVNLQERQAHSSLALQNVQLKENERIGRAKAGYESLSKVIDYQSRQVNEFYSPLRLMLRRSAGVRRQLCDQLHAKAPDRFAFVKDEDNREHLFVFGTDGANTRFRLIEHIHELATQHAELLPLVHEIVSIGESMSELIHSKGGMTSAGSDALTDLLGLYLAHFSILRDVAKKAKEAPHVLAQIRYNVAYPIELDPTLDADMKALAEELERWKTLSTQMWLELTGSKAEPSGET